MDQIVRAGMDQTIRAIELSRAAPAKREKASAASWSIASVIGTIRKDREQIFW
jgi:hypothetical protein